MTNRLNHATVDSIAKYMKHGYNILLIADHGVGKTEMTKQAAELNGYKMAVFNAALMDPYMDLIGIPETVVNEEGEKQLQMIRNKEMIDDVDVIFFDEWNRASVPVLNAVMTIINEKSINGKKLPKLKAVVAACNPSSDSETGSQYSVSDIDPAQLDRFAVKMSVDTRASAKYLSDVLGNDKIGKALAEWQNKLEFFSGNNPRAPYVSPREMERVGRLFLDFPEKRTLHDVFGVESGLPINALYRELVTALNTNEEASNMNIEEYLVSEMVSYAEGGQHDLAWKSLTDNMNEIESVEEIENIFDKVISSIKDETTVKNFVHSVATNVYDDVKRQREDNHVKMNISKYRAIMVYIGRKKKDL